MDKVIAYLIVVNLAAFLLYGLDKLKAKKNLWRIPEKVLLGVAFIGGSIGAFAGMQFFRHKTQKIKFIVGVPVVFFLQLAAGVYLIYYL